MSILLETTCYEPWKQRDVSAVYRLNLELGSMHSSILAVSGTNPSLSDHVCREIGDLIAKKQTFTAGFFRTDWWLDRTILARNLSPTCKRSHSRIPRATSTLQWVWDTAASRISGLHFELFSSYTSWQTLSLNRLRVGRGLSWVSQLIIPIECNLATATRKTSLSGDLNHVQHSHKRI